MDTEQQKKIDDWKAAYIFFERYGKDTIQYMPLIIAYDDWLRAFLGLTWFRL